MSRPKSTSRIRTHELEEVYALVPGGGVDEAEVEYAPQLSWLRGNTIARQIREGFYVHWASEVFDREVRLCGVEGQGFFVFTFALAGMWQDVVGARRKLFDRPGGTMAVLRCDHIVEHRALPTPGAMHLTIAIEREQLLKWFGEGELEQHPRLGRFLRGEGDGCLILPLTARARETVQQMQNCPFRGLTRSLAMEARCIDLLVEMIEQTERPQQLPQAGKGRFLAKTELERIHAAAEHLAGCLNQPPALEELARRFHLSESKLKAGFHQAFGTTAFGYLRRLRMQEARRLLETGASSILEASHLVGISNPSHFAALFKEHFGVNPKQFQMNAIRRK
ncbi:MAG: helix-turn-helix transcriptional regulator [Prosthecobacter sp.]|jgi:AraC-like DNA-binding protein|uniref:helix-turn-helix transcriptional regulator n=1 Tax=Prosthecobacter sp. TaxID=1965333 RepID=UPI0019F7F590|nr:helix-turn-helix transcriptional regulator [Prosthecobacter sp.]MBE2284401.1 helix-turn-helix transcriptional regulator [Prosthecobacter sp.]